MTRAETIEAIIAAARRTRPQYTAVPRSSVQGSDGKWYSALGGFPSGVTATGEQKIYWVKQASDGTTYGTRFDSELALLEADEKDQAERDQEFRTALEAESEKRLKEQVAYWLK